MAIQEGPASASDESGQTLADLVEFNNDLVHHPRIPLRQLRSNAIYEPIARDVLLNEQRDDPNWADYRKIMA